jgi:hypothetical protein
MHQQQKGISVARIVSPVDMRIQEKTRVSYRYTMMYNLFTDAVAHWQVK